VPNNQVGTFDASEWMFAPPSLCNRRNSTDTETHHLNENILVHEKTSAAELF
jgi:hypothetical protein